MSYIYIVVYTDMDAPKLAVLSFSPLLFISASNIMVVGWCNCPWVKSDKYTFIQNCSNVCQLSSTLKRIAKNWIDSLLCWNLKLCNWSFGCSWDLKQNAYIIYKDKKKYTHSFYTTWLRLFKLCLNNKLKFEI